MQAELNGSYRFFRYDAAIVTAAAAVGGAFFSRNRGSIHDRDRNGLLFAFTIDLHANGFSDRAVGHDIEKGGSGWRPHTINLGDDIVLADTGFRCGTAGRNVGDNDP